MPLPTVQADVIPPPLAVWNEPLHVQGGNQGLDMVSSISYNPTPWLRRFVPAV